MYVDIVISNAFNLNNNNYYYNFFCVVRMMAATAVLWSE